MNVVETSLSSFRIPLLFVLLSIVIGSAIGVFVVDVNKPLLILVGLAAVIASAFTLASVETGLLFLVFITYTRFSDVLVQVHNAPSVAKSFIALLLAVIIIRWVLFRETPTGWQLPALLVGIYGLIGFASLLYAHDSSRVVITLENYVKDVLIALVVIAALKRVELIRNVVWSLLAAGAFMGTLSVYQYLTKTFTANYWGFSVAKYMQITAGSPNDYRLVGPVGDPNFYAQVMVVLVPLALERALHERKLILKIFSGWTAIVSILTVMFTFSRGGALALFISLAIFLFLYPPRPLHLVIFIGTGLILLLFIPTTYFDRILSLQDLIPSASGNINVRTDPSFQGRASEFLTGWLMYEENPIVGVGLSNYVVRYQEFAKRVGLAPGSEPRSAHNLYLEVAAETGTLGFSVFMLIVWLAMRSILIARKTLFEIGEDDCAHLTTAFAIAFIGYLVAALFIHAAYPRYFYLLIGIAFALSPAVKRLTIAQAN